MSERLQAAQPCFRPGDAILSVGNQDASDALALARLIASSPPGRLLDMTLLRAGMELRVSVQVAMAESDPKKAMSVLGHPPAEAKIFATPSAPGIGMSAIDAEMRKNLRLDPGQNGVVVTSVDPKGVAAGHGIAVADVILAVGGEPVSTPTDVQRELRSAVDHHRAFAALLVAGKSTRWVALPLEADR